MKTEPSEKGNAHLAARRAKKAALLPRAAELAGEGRTYQEIADALGIAKSTVCQWLRDRTLGRAAAKALGTPRMTAKLAARYESLYQRALREWNRSKADRRTQTVVTSEPAEGGPTTTTTVRTEPQKRNAACLGKAVAAMKAMEGLHWRELSRQDWLENLQRDAAADKDEDGLTRTVKTTMTRSGRNLRTVVTRRSDAGRLAALRDEQEALDEKRLRLEMRLDADEDAAADDEEIRAAIRAEAAAAEEKLRIAEARLDPAEALGAGLPTGDCPGREGGRGSGASPHRARLPKRKRGCRYRVGGVGEQRSGEKAERLAQVVCAKCLASAAGRVCQRSPFGNVAERSLPKGWVCERTKKSETRPPQGQAAGGAGIRAASRVGGNLDARTGSGFRRSGMKDEGRRMRDEG